jgi:hypothetical protein
MLALHSFMALRRLALAAALISSQSVAAIDTAAIWMSSAGFWIYDGYVKPLPSDVSDYVFGNMNFNQASKVYAVHNQQVW